jgi:hypothetical protein
MTVATDNPAGPSIQDVDLAIRSVLARWLAPVAGNGRTEARAAGSDVEVFPGRLLSLRQVETLPPGLRVVQVVPGTVVTPLARDHLKRQGVEIRFAARADAQRLRNVGEWGFAVTVESGLIVAVRRSLLDAPEGWQELDPSLEAAALWVAGVAGRGALVLTDDAPLAVYRACQVPGLRAAAVSEPEAVARAVRTLGINLLVVEPAGKSISLIRQLATTFRRGGGPVPPGWL